MFRKKEKEKPTPIITLSIQGDDINGIIIESFMTGEELWKDVWKHFKIWSTGKNYKINFTCGHKFFHWANVNNKRVHIITSVFNKDISLYNNFNILQGELLFTPKKSIRAIQLKITRVI